jgi:hypothetical protein
MEFLVLAVTFLVFLVLREVWCWYWKINETLAQVKQVEARLATIEKGAFATVEHLSAILKALKERP